MWTTARLMQEVAFVLNRHDPVRIALPLIKHFEQFYPERYICPAGKPTIGYGHVITAGETFGVITEAQASRMLRTELITRYLPDMVNALKKRGITLKDIDACQEAAILSFVYNCGAGSIAGPSQASWPACLMTNNIVAAKRSWLAWNKGGGRVLAGLVRRRFAEWQLFMNDRWEENPPGWRDYYQARK